jgi:hypothetical protein
VQQGLEAADQAAVRDHCLQRLYGAGIRNRLAAGDLAAAAELARAAETPETQATTCTVCSLQLYPALASYYLASGDAATAGAYAERALRLAEAGHNQAGEAEALRVQGEVRSATGDLAGAEACLERAAAIFRRLDQVYDLAATLQAWGSLPLQDPARLEPIRREAEGILLKLRGSSRHDGSGRP